MAQGEAALLDGVAETVLAQLKVDSADPDVRSILAAGRRPARHGSPGGALVLELLITAKTQRRAPEELLRTLIDAELAARDASNARTQMKNAAFPVIKTLEELDRTTCRQPPRPAPPPRQHRRHQRRRTPRRAPGLLRG